MIVNWNEWLYAHKYFSDIEAQLQAIEYEVDLRD